MMGLIPPRDFFFPPNNNFSLLNNPFYARHCNAVISRDRPCLFPLPSPMSWSILCSSFAHLHIPKEAVFSKILLNWLSAGHSHREAWAEAWRAGGRDKLVASIKFCSVTAKLSGVLLWAFISFSHVGESAGGAPLWAVEAEGNVFHASLLQVVWGESLLLVSLILCGQVGYPGHALPITMAEVERSKCLCHVC